jgi:hypothetical protein
MTNRIITRRRFIQGAAAGAASLAFPLVLPRAALGRTTPSEKVTLAMIGVGSRGMGVMQGFARHDDVQFLAVCDPFRDRREAARDWLNEKYGGKTVTAYEDLRDLLARPDIDAVIICTMDHWHVPAAVYAARAGKDMYVEKPLSVSMGWSWRLREAVRRYGRIFQYGTQQRSSWPFRFACELARNGYLGTIQRVDAWSPDVVKDREVLSVKPNGSTEPAPVPDGFNYDLWLGPSPQAPYTVDRCKNVGAFHTYDYALGYIAGWGVHQLDIAQWGLDMDGSSPVLIEGRGEIPTTGLHNAITLWDVRGQYANGVKLHFMCDRVAQPVVMKYRDRWCSHGTTFHGKDGWVSVDRDGIYASDPKLPRIKLRPDEIHLYESPGQDRNFIDCIRSRRTTINPLESAIRCDTISHLSDIAIRTGRPIRWDPQREHIIGDEAASRMLNRPMRAPWQL